MNGCRSAWTPRRVVALTGLLVVLYLLWVGPERFVIESSGTWVVSPSIYTRLLPAPWNAWLVRSLLHAPWTCVVVLAIPVVMVFIAIAVAAVAVIKNSMLLALAAFILTGLLVGAYHFLQPLGITLHYL